MTSHTEAQLPAPLTSIPARVLAACAGVVMVGFFAILFIAALVNLPASWFGIVYTGYGLAAGVCAFRYAYAPKRSFLFVAAPALLLTLITLSGVVP
jgi:hypothetical protein